MTQSMTAFAYAEKETTLGTLSWSLRSVNHRYLETSFKLPEIFRETETTLRSTLKNHLARGKVECILAFQPHAQNNAFHIDPLRANQLITAAEQIALSMNDPAQIDPLKILSWPQVLSAEKLDTTALNQTLLSLFQQVLTDLQESRAREGQALAQILINRLEAITEEITILRPYIADMLTAQRQKIKDRCQELQISIDPQRLEQELVLFLQKADVEEELDRIETHLKEVHRILSSKGAQGRKLDFLMQELNREANTLGSKAINTQTTNAAVNLKVLIEQMREQIQNIE